MSAPRPFARPAGLAALAGAAGWIVCLILDPAAALTGWLAAFVFASSLSLGALAALLIHRLTGGAWGVAFGPDFERLSGGAPLLILFCLPFVLFSPVTFSWARAGAHLKPGVGPDYLNPVFYGARTLVILAGWSALAALRPRLDAQGRLGAALGLAFHGIAVTVAGIDWILSTVPSFVSSDVGMELASEQLLAGFAFAGLQLRGPAERSRAGDLSGLLFATIIGVIYLQYCVFLITWYGDKPGLDRWYLTREYAPFAEILLAALALALAGVAGLAFRRIWGTPATLRAVAAVELAALFLMQVWQVTSAEGLLASLSAVPAALLQAGLLLAVGDAPLRRLTGYGGLAHAA